MKTLTIIDTFGFFFRSYFALPPLRNSEGFPTGLLTGFINLIDSLHRDHATDYLVFALDSKGKTFRSDIYPEYTEENFEKYLLRNSKIISKSKVSSSGRTIYEYKR